MKEVTIWTDGACSGNPGPGGWGAILEYKDTRLEMSGGEYMTTNNRMELTAAIEALESLKEPCAVTLYSDSEYMVNAMTKGWATGWKKRGWMKADKTPAKNPDLFEKLLDLCAIHQVKFIWVRGHAADENNNRCDELAVAQRDAHTR
ncbi:MAG: ribonuclease HI [Eubacteriales bacterium]